MNKKAVYHEFIISRYTALELANMIHSLNQLAWKNLIILRVYLNLQHPGPELLPLKHAA